MIIILTTLSSLPSDYKRPVKVSLSGYSLTTADFNRAALQIQRTLHRVTYMSVVISVFDVQLLKISQLTVQPACHCKSMNACQLNILALVHIRNRQTVSVNCQLTCAEAPTLTYIIYMLHISSNRHTASNTYIGYACTLPPKQTFTLNSAL